MSTEIVDRIRDAAAAAGLRPLDDAAVNQLGAYVSLILRWNARINLTAIRDEDRIISLHIIESIHVSASFPKGVVNLLDFGSGAGLPGIPIAICRPEIEVTLAESQNRKAAFLMEAVRVLGLAAKVHSGRAEELTTQFDCLTLRAVDKMPEAVSTAAKLVAPEGWLALMTTGADGDLLKTSAGAGFIWRESIGLAAGGTRLLLLGQKSAA